jgi:hypothetical protein
VVGSPDKHYSGGLEDEREDEWEDEPEYDSDTVVGRSPHGQSTGNRQDGESDDNVEFEEAVDDGSSDSADDVSPAEHEVIVVSSDEEEDADELDEGVDDDASDPAEHKVIVIDSDEEEDEEDDE